MRTTVIKQWCCLFKLYSNPVSVFTYPTIPWCIRILMKFSHLFRDDQTVIPAFQNSKVSPRWTPDERKMIKASCNRHLLVSLALHVRCFKPSPIRPWPQWNLMNPLSWTLGRSADLNVQFQTLVEAVPRGWIPEWMPSTNSDTRVLGFLHLFGPHKDNGLFQWYLVNPRNVHRAESQFHSIHALPVYVSYGTRRDV